MIRRLMDLLYDVTTTVEYWYRTRTKDRYCNYCRRVTHRWNRAHQHTFTGDRHV